MLEFVADKNVEHLDEYYVPSFELLVVKFLVLEMPLPKICFISYLIQ